MGSTQGSITCPMKRTVPAEETRHVQVLRHGAGWGFGTWAGGVAQGFLESRADLFTPPKSSGRQSQPQGGSCELPAAAHKGHSMVRKGGILVEILPPRGGREMHQLNFQLCCTSEK